MNNTEHNTNLIAIARDLVLQSDSASYQRGIIEMLANYLEVDYTEAVDLIHDTRTPKNEHTILVAFHLVGPETMKDAQLELMKHIGDPEINDDNSIESWWVAMDERYQGSDNDSAEFVPGSGRDAWYRYHEQAGTPGIHRPAQVNTFAEPVGIRRRGYIVTDYNNPTARSMNRTRELRLTVLNRIQGHEFANITEGRNFIDEMNKLIAVYGIATINDAANLLGFTGTFEGEKMGWHTRLTYESLRPIKFQHEHRLDLPTPTHKVR